MIDSENPKAALEAPRSAAQLSLQLKTCCVKWTEASQPYATDGGQSTWSVVAAGCNCSPKPGVCTSFEVEYEEYMPAP